MGITIGFIQVIKINLPHIPSLILTGTKIKIQEFVSIPAQLVPAPHLLHQFYLIIAKINCNKNNSI